jgi:hypothetical protein
MSVQRSDDRTGQDRLRPDVLVRCGSVSGRNFVTDRGEKLVFYKRLPTLRHIVPIYQDRMCVEHFQRIDDELVLDAVGFTISLAQVHFAIDLSIVRRIRWRGQG